MAKANVLPCSAPFRGNSSATWRWLNPAGLRKPLVASKYFRRLGMAGIGGRLLGVPTASRDCKRVDHHDRSHGQQTPRHPVFGFVQERSGRCSDLRGGVGSLLEWAGLVTVKVVVVIYNGGFRTTDTFDFQLFYEKQLGAGKNRSDSQGQE